MTGLLKKLFSSSTPSVLGLDLGSDSIKLAELVKVSNRFQLAKFAFRPTPAQAIRDGIIVDSEAVAAEIKALFRDGGFRTKSVVTAVSGQSVVVRTITMTAMNLRELKNSVRYEAERYIPYSVEDAQIDGVILRPSIPGDEKNMEVLLMAAPRDVVQKAENVIQKAGLSAQAIELEPIALLRLLNMIVSPEDLMQTIAMINIGATATSINIVNNGILRSSRTVPVSGGGFTRALGQSLNLSFADAEQLKREKAAIRVAGEDKPADVSDTRVFNTLLPSLTELVTEVQRSFDFYRSRYPGESVDIVYLSGGGAHLKNLDRYFAGELSLRVEKFDPFRKIGRGSGTKLTEEEAKENGLSSSVVLGLAGWHLI